MVSSSPSFRPATAAAIVATVAQLAWVRLSGRRIEPMHWLSLAVIVVFGGATLLLQDETFIKWKPTVLYWLFAAVLAGADPGPVLALCDPARFDRTEVPA